MIKSTKIIILSLAAAIVLTAAAIGTVFAVHKMQIREADGESSSTQQTAESLSTTQHETASTTTDAADPGDLDMVDVPQTASESTTAQEKTTKPTTTKAATTQLTATKPTTTKSAVKPAKSGVYTLALAGDSGVLDLQGAGQYKAGDSVTVSASLLFGRYFDRWASSDSSLLADGDRATYTFKMPAGNVTLKAITSARSTVTLKRGQGVESVKGDGTYPVGEMVTVTAVMKEGYDFAGWTSASGNSSGSISYTFTMPESPVILTATGRARTYRVTLVAGTGIASVTGSGQYKVDETVSVSATLMKNYTFQSWSNNSTKQSHSFVMPAHDVTITASAKPAPKYAVTLARGDNGIASVSGGGTYFAGEKVTVSCTVAVGYVFDGWTSSAAELLSGSKKQTYSFYAPKGDVKLTAKSKNNQYTLTLQCGNGISAVNGSGKYTAGSKVTVNCRVMTGYRFHSWMSSDSKLIKNSATQSYTFTMPQANVTLTAKALSDSYTLVLKRGEGISSVSGGGKYLTGKSVTVSCTPAAGYTFKEWVSSDTSKLSGSYAQSYTFAMPQSSISLTAKAVKSQYQLTLQKGSGIASVSGSGTYTVGDIVTVGCTPKTGYAFLRWESNRSSLLSGSTSQTFSFNMPKGDIILTAKAEKNAYSVSISKGYGISTVSGEGTYTAGDTVTVYAETLPDYWFDAWMEGSSVKSTDNAYTFTMPKRNVSLTAKAYSY